MKMSELKQPPIKIGDILKLGVQRFGANGDPILIHEGFIIFLKNIEKGGVALNTMMEVKIMKVLPKFAFAEKVNGS